MLPRSVFEHANCLAGGKHEQRSRQGVGLCVHERRGIHAEPEPTGYNLHVQGDQSRRDDGDGVGDIAGDTAQWRRCCARRIRCGRAGRLGIRRRSARGRSRRASHQVRRAGAAQLHIVVARLRPCNTTLTADPHLSQRDDRRKCTQAALAVSKSGMRIFVACEVGAIR